MATHDYLAIWVGVARRGSGDVTLRPLILDAKDAGLTDQRNERTTHGSVGEERGIAILFVDIRGSTSFAESVPPFDVIHVLRRFEQVRIPFS
jgi:adenylate cyclase